MTSFVATVADRPLAEQLERAVHGRGAFRRFRDTLAGTTMSSPDGIASPLSDAAAEPGPGLPNTAANPYQNQPIATPRNRPGVGGT
jgi:hypothetical protein